MAGPLFLHSTSVFKQNDDYTNSIDGAIATVNGVVVPAPSAVVVVIFTAFGITTDASFYLTLSLCRMSATNNADLDTYTPSSPSLSQVTALSLDTVGVPAITVVAIDPDPPENGTYGLYLQGNNTDNYTIHQMSITAFSA